MMFRFSATLALCLLSSAYALASEYCVNQYDEQIAKVDAELSKILKRQVEIDKRIAEILVKSGELAGQMVSASTKNPPDMEAIQKIGREIALLGTEKNSLTDEGSSNNEKVVPLKTSVPAEIKGKLRGCVEATAPANLLVNFAIQAVAIVSTSGGSLALPPKSLYVDMSAVLNGYPAGGSQSAINEGREAALRALPGGLGNPNNDFGRTARDPGRVFRCLTGC